MTPDQIKLCIQLAIAAVLLAVAAAAGWTVNGWRLGAEVSRLNGIVETQKQGIETMAGANKRCTAGLDDVRGAVKGYVDAGVKASREAAAAAQRAAASAQGHLDAAQEALNRAMPPPGQECDKAAAEAAAYAKKRKGAP